MGSVYCRMQEVPELILVPEMTKYITFYRAESKFDIHEQHAFNEFLALWKIQESSETFLNQVMSVYRIKLGPKEK